MDALKSYSGEESTSEEDLKERDVKNAQLGEERKVDTSSLANNDEGQRLIGIAFIQCNVKEEKGECDGSPSTSRPQPDHSQTDSPKRSNSPPAGPMEVGERMQEDKADRQSCRQQRSRSRDHSSPDHDRESSSRRRSYHHHHRQYRGRGNTTVELSTPYHFLKGEFFSHTHLYMYGFKYHFSTFHEYVWMSSFAHLL